jgi:lambda family phage portal protein
MSFRSFFSKAFKKKEMQTRKRGYTGAVANRLTADWVLTPMSADAEIRASLSTLRARSRDLTINNDYARKFLKMLVRNTVGPNGIRLQSKIQDTNGLFDSGANRLIEDAWKKWSKKENTSVTEKLSWRDLQRLFIETVAKDGEIIVRKVKGFDNGFGFALQVIEADHLDEQLNKELPNGNTIRMGIEFDTWRRPVNYYILTHHPGDYLYGNIARNKHEVVPAEEIIHAFICERVSQSRGVPWMHTAMTRLKMLGGYEEAELVAARIGACKMGFFVSPDGQGYTGDDTDATGNKITEAEPGVFEQLPTGTGFESFNPDHPSGNFEAFEKAILRGIASGLDVSYNSLASDLEGVNYSSIRSGVLEERDSWQIIQSWMIDHFCQPIFEEWLSMALLTQAVRLPISKFDKFNSAVWRPRGWDWVDPLRDLKAQRESLDAGLTTRAKIVASKGEDLEEIFEQLEQEEKLQEQHKLEFAKVGGNKNAPI